VNNFSEQDRVNLNVQAALDATIIGGPMLKLARIMKGVVKGNAPKNLNIGNALEAVGDTQKAAEVKAVEITKALEQPEVLPTMNRGYDPLGQKLDLTSVLPSSHKPESIATPGALGSMSREDALRLVGQLKQQNTLIDKTTEELVHTTRLTPERTQAGLAEARANLEYQFPHVLDGVLDFKTSEVHPWEHLRAQDTPSNVDYAVLNLGKRG